MKRGKLLKMVNERRKYLGHPYKDYIKTSSSRIARVDQGALKGYASYLAIKEVNRPLIIAPDAGGAEICLYNNGYSEICFLPDNDNWMLWALYDNNGKIIEWYFDITRKNRVDEKGNPYCDDLYLDIVLMPDGKTIILDEDELQNALDNGNITKDEYDMAYRVKDELLKKIVNIPCIETLCGELSVILKNK
jgi:predicted RNA-binding protein associated with RNAse of E/G family